MKPIVKWAGGKSQLLDNILPLVPEFNKYYEPFFGGGALYFALKPKKAVINDFNKQLMNIYIYIKNNETCERLKNELITLENAHIDSDEYYLSMRDEYNNCLTNDATSIRASALFIYLNKAGFNGLYRLNSDGLFNVPNGHHKKVKLVDENNFNEVHKQLQKTIIKNGDFEECLKTCKEGDFVFFDSPYYKTFDAYQKDGFKRSDHIRLANLFYKLSNRGVKCLLTNSDESFMKELYGDFDIKVVDVKRMINCDGANRKGREIIVKNF